MQNHLWSTIIKLHKKKKIPHLREMLVFYPFVLLNMIPLKGSVFTKNVSWLPARLLKRHDSSCVVRTLFRIIFSVDGGFLFFFWQKTHTLSEYINNIITECFLQSSLISLYFSKTHSHVSLFTNSKPFFNVLCCCCGHSLI